LPAQTRTEVLVLDLSGEGPLEVSTVTLSEELRKGGSSIQALVVNPSGTAAWLGHYDGLIQRIALPNGEVTAEATHSEKNGVAAFALREGLLVTTSSATDTEPDTEGPTIGRLDFRLRFWDAETLRPLDEFRLTAIAMAVCIAPGGESVFIGTLFGHVQHWSRSGKLLNNMVGEDIEAPHVGGRLWAKGGNLPRAHNDRITALRRGPTGLLYSIARAAGTRGQESAEFAVWNLDAGHAVNNAFRGVSGQLISDFSISPDGRRALMAYWGGKLELWER
jgi:WD40 repeat protein